MNVNFQEPVTVLKTGFIKLALLGFPSVFAFLCGCHGTHVEVRGQLPRVFSFLPPCGFQGQTVGHQSEQQAPLLLSCLAGSHFILLFETGSLTGTQEPLLVPTPQPWYYKHTVVGA